MRSTFSLPVFLTISSRAASPLSRLRETMITDAPPAAKAFAVTLPMPELAPVTRQIFSFIDQLSIFHIMCDICHNYVALFIIAGTPPGALWYTMNVIWKTEWEEP